MSKIQFAVLSYYPSIITNENINVGVLFHNIDTDEREFYTLRSWRRLESFDDELDIDFMKKYLNGMKTDVVRNLFNKNEEFDLKEYTRFYINKLRFSEIQCFDGKENVEEFKEMTQKVYMRYDFDKKERLSTENEVKYLKMIMRNNNIDYSSKPVDGKYADKIYFDYVVGDYGFKNFVFNDKKVNSMVAAAKLWSYNALELKGKYKTVFVYDVEMEDSSIYNIIMDILKENAFCVIKNDEVMKFVLKRQNIEDKICV